MSDKGLISRIAGFDKDIGKLEILHIVPGNVQQYSTP